MYSVKSQEPLPAGERAYQHVRNRIVAGQYDDHHMLTEGEVADELGVSRTPVREALVRLAADNLLILVPKRGAIVRPLTHTEWQELVSARILLETWAVEEIIRTNSTEQVCKELIQSIDEMETTLSEPNLMGFVVADHAFHASLIRGAKNNVIMEIYNTLRLRQMRSTAKKAREQGFEYDSLWAQLAIGQHKEIADLLRDKNSDALATLLKQHLESLISA